MTEAVPAEYRADLVAALVRNGKPVLGIVVDIQRSRDQIKRYSWPAYVTQVRSRLKCPCTLLVITPQRSLVRWCAKPIELGHPDFVLRPLVVGPDAVPAIIDVNRASRAPELAVLSVIAHGRTKPVQQAVQIATTTLAALMELAASEQLDDEQTRIYTDLVMASLGKTARQRVENMLMVTEGYEYQSDFAKRYVAQGEAKGRAEGRAGAIIAVLSARGIEPSAETLEHINNCTDLEQLDEWVRRAVTANSADELFG